MLDLRLRHLAAPTLALLSVACAPRTPPADLVVRPEPAPELLIVTPAPAPTAEALAAEAARRAAPRVAPIIYIDGVRISPEESGRIMDTLDPQSIDRIEVVSGPAAMSRFPSDPGAAAGVISVFTKRSPEQR